MKMLLAIPALPVGDISRSVAYYREELGFTAVYQDEGFAVLRKDDIEINLWLASDEAWRAREDSAPVVSGAESFIAGTASCRVGIEGVDDWHIKLQPLGVVHPNGPLRDTEWHTREFAVLDPDGNLITFFERR